MNPADFETIPQAAARVKLSRQRVALLAKQGRIEGAFFLGRQWFIPKNWKHKPGEKTEQPRQSYHARE